MNTETEPTSTIYSTPDCYACRATRREFDKTGLPYAVVDVSVDDSAREKLAGMGYRSAPVVIAPSGQHWSGHRPDRIHALNNGAICASDATPTNIDSPPVTPALSAAAPDRAPPARASTLDDDARQ